MSGAANTLRLEWAPPGRVSAAFMASSARLQVLNGPIGSGKTTTNLMKAIRLGTRQKPSMRQKIELRRGVWAPVRQFKLCVVRDTYRQLWRSTLPSWFKRVPREVGEFVGAENAPARHRVTFELPDGSVVDFLAEFVAIGDNSAEEVLRGYEPTAFYLNELDLLSRDVLTFARGRAGRYPDMEDGGPTWHGVLADCNAPELSSWLFKDIFTPAPADLAAARIELFRQPSGLAPDAENLANLPPGYYEEQVSGAAEWYVERMVKNRPGYSRAGKPVYPEFQDRLHVAGADLPVLVGVALTIGLDAGLNPAAVLGQHSPNGQWRVLDELVGETGMGPMRFGDMLAQRLRERFPGVRTIHAWADPSAAYGADTRGGEQSWIEIVRAKTGIPIRPAPTNRLIPRLEAVRKPLSRLIDGQPGFLMSPRCVILREGFNSGYRFRKMNVQEERYDDEPEKNRFSHPHDSLQYLCSGGGEDAEIRERTDRGRQALRTPHEHEWDPFAGAAA